MKNGKSVRLPHVLTALLILVSLYSCTPQLTRRFPSAQQQEFDDILSNYKESSRKYSGNQIKERELLDSMNRTLFDYVDSVRLFRNWEGKISQIDSEQSDSLIMLTFNISYRSYGSGNVTFECKYIFPKDSILTDELYQKVRDLSSYETVYFDGFIRTFSNKTITSDLFDDFILHHPEFEFFVIDISTEPNEADNPNLQRAIDLTFEALEPLKQNYEGSLSKTECDQQVQDVTLQYNAAKSKLNKSERQYIQRLGQAYIYNFLFADDLIISPMFF